MGADRRNLGYIKKMILKFLEMLWNKIKNDFKI